MVQRWQLPAAAVPFSIMDEREKDSGCTEIQRFLSLFVWMEALHRNLYYILSIIINVFFECDKTVRGLAQGCSMNVTCDIYKLKPKDAGKIKPEN